MGHRDKLTDEAIATFISGHAGWSVSAPLAGSGGPPALAKTFAFDHYGAAIGFAVHVGFAAEQADHHPELHITWGKVRVAWWTHDAGGVTELDTRMAELTDRIYGG